VAKGVSSWSVCLFIRRIELTTEEAVDAGMGQLGREGKDSRAAAARVCGGGGSFSPLKTTGAETRRLLGNDGMRLGKLLVMVAFVGVEGTGVALGLRSASGARLGATTRESGRFRATLGALFFVESDDTAEEERGLLCPFACVSGGESWGICGRGQRDCFGPAVTQIRKVNGTTQAVFQRAVTLSGMDAYDDGCSLLTTVTRSELQEAPTASI
jgi:hypothetical protein